MALVASEFDRLLLRIERAGQADVWAIVDALRTSQKETDWLLADLLEGLYIAVQTYEGRFGPLD